MKQSRGSGADPQKRRRRQPARKTPKRPPEESPEPTIGSSIELIADVCARGIDLAARLENAQPNAPRHKQLRRIRTDVAAAFEQLLALSSDDASAEQLVGALRVAADLSDRSLAARDVKGSGASFPAIPFDAFALTEACPDDLDLRFLPPAPPTPPPPEAPPEPLRRLLEEIIRILEEFIDDLVRRNGRGRDLIEYFRRVLRYFRRILDFVRRGGRLRLSFILDVLRRFTLALYRLNLPARLGRLGINFLRAIGAAIVTFLQSIGTAFGAEAGLAALAARLGAILVALGVGIAIGKFVGGIEIDGMTVDDWLAEGIYLQYFADDCDELYDVYLRARNRRRAYQNSGPTLDKTVTIPLLAAEYAALLRYLQKPCPDTGGVLGRELARVKMMLDRLIQ